MNIVGPDRYELKLYQYRVSKDHLVRSVVILDKSDGDNPIYRSQPETEIASAPYNEEQTELVNLAKILNKDDHLYKWEVLRWYDSN
jgi:hypothetical protein